MNPVERQNEITDTFYQLSRFLTTPEKNGFSPDKLAKMLEQSAFHVANPMAMKQYGNTCSVTDIAGCLLHSNPSEFVKAIATAGTTGDFRRADDSEIFLPRSAIEETFKGQPPLLNPLQALS